MYENNNLKTWEKLNKFYKNNNLSIIFWVNMNKTYKK